MDKLIQANAFLIQYHPDVQDIAEKHQAKSYLIDSQEVKYKVVQFEKLSDSQLNTPEIAILDNFRVENAEYLQEIRRWNHDFETGFAEKYLALDNAFEHLKKSSNISIAQLNHINETFGQHLDADLSNLKEISILNIPKDSIDTNSIESYIQNTKALLETLTPNLPTIEKNKSTISNDSNSSYEP